jgi:uncharacterized repeat protein (TIGR03803 family)
MKFNRTFILAIFLLSQYWSLTYGQNTELYGLLGVGGPYGAGGIFKTDGNGENLQILYSPKISASGAYSHNDLCQAGNGKYYGVTVGGGKYSYGTLFEYDLSSGIFITKFDFSNNGEGYNPLGNLIQAENGKLYGMTKSGGANNFGVLYEWDPVTDQYTKKLDFNGTENGSNPVSSLVLHGNGKLYGMTSSGGTDNKGVLFEWDPSDDSLTKKIDFKGESNGADPHGGTLIQSDNGRLYGMTTEGGSYNAGVIFEFDPASGTFRKKVDFPGTPGGGKPYGTLLKASDGRFYGMTSEGGIYNCGVIFEWDTTSNKLITRIDFNYVTGRMPYGSLFQGENGKLYGMTNRGGELDGGVLFEWDPITNIYAEKHDFKITSKTGTVYGSLCRGTNGKLLGMTCSSGANERGAIFEWDPVNDSYKDLINFSTSENGNYFSGTPVKADNGKLYGLAANGGNSNMGILFEWDPFKQMFTRKVDFTEEKGSYPWGSLIKADNQKLYGTTYSGGVNNMGVLFEWDYAANTYTKMVEFDGLELGKFPEHMLVSADNGKLYGMTTRGGKYDQGVLFEYDPEMNTCSRKLDFNDQMGYLQGNSFVEAANGKLYGMTPTGGISNNGTIFEWDITKNSYTKKIDFNGRVTGSEPLGTLVQADNGKMYGMTRSGGSYGQGVIFEWDPVNNIISGKRSFSGNQDGAQPYGDLLLASNGKMYGMTGLGGATHGGILFEWDYKNNFYTRKYAFDPKNGSNPYYGGLTEICSRSTSGIMNVTACDKYNFNGKVLTSSGTYYKTIPNAAGCDSVITLNLTIRQASVNTIYENACSFYNFNGRILKSSGTYVDIIPNAAGCDSITVLFLTIVHPSSSSMNINACNDYLFGGKVLTRSGIYIDTIPNAVGCDSVITLQLIIKHSSASTLYVSACDSYTSPGGGHIWTRSGTYTDTIPNASGCDSIITIHLDAPHRSVSFIPIEACDKYVSPSGRYIWTTSGIHVDNIQNKAGCDSVITVDLTLQKSTAAFIHQDACNSYTSPSGMYTWTSSGTYSDIIPNARGCDSILTIELQVDNVDTSVIQDRSILISKDRKANHQWIDCDEGNEPIPGETWLSYTARKNGHYAVIVSEGACVDTSAIYEILLTGVADPAENRIMLYPNPTAGKFTIDLGRICTKATVTITRYDGEIVWKENVLNSCKIELPIDGPPGLYLVTLREDSKEVVFKVVKE